MTVLKSPTAQEFSTYVETHPAELAIWRAGEPAMYPILTWLNVHPVVTQRDRAVRDGPHFAAMSLTRVHHNQVGISVSWALRYLSGRKSEAGVGEQDLLEMFDLAARYWGIRNLLADLGQGVRTFESKGRTIVFGYRGNAELESIDRLLDLFETVQSIPEGPPFDLSAVSSWLHAGGATVGWDGVPLLIRQEYRELARSRVAKYPAYLASDLDVGGFTIAEATAVLAELLAEAFQSQAAVLAGQSDPELIAPIFARGRLLGRLQTGASVRRDAAERILELLTTNLTACPDPCLTPVVRLPSGGLVPMGTLIIPGSPVRNFTARLQLDSARFGEAGRQLGLLGSRTVAATLKTRLEGARIAERVRVRSAGGRSVGDLDVVAFDPAVPIIAVFEVLWNINPDGSAEVGKSEARANDKRSQVAGLRTALAEKTAAAEWPAGWSVPPETEIRWFILTSNVLPALPPHDDGIIIRSHQLLERVRWDGNRVVDMVAALTNPPAPPAQLSQTRWRSMKYGSYDLRVEVLPA